MTAGNKHWRGFSCNAGTMASLPQQYPIHGDGVYVWGCMSSLETIKQVQLCAFRMFFGAYMLHPKASTVMEIKSLQVVWEARVSCVQFWYKVLTSKVYEGRLLRKVTS